MKTKLIVKKKKNNTKTPVATCLAQNNATFISIKLLFPRQT